MTQVRFHRAARRRTQMLPWGLGLAVLAATACDRDPATRLVGNGINCPGIGIPSIAAEIRNARGEPAAMGSTVRTRNTKGFQGVTKAYDSLRVFVFGGGGTLEVQVTKPWHNTVTIQGVQVIAGTCGVKTARVAVSVNLVQGAPPVRQVVTAPYAYSFSYGNYTDRLYAFVEADSGVSQAVNWSSRDTTVARITPEGFLTTACRKTTREAWMIAASAIDPRLRDSVSVTVEADQNPSRCA